MGTEFSIEKDETIEDLTTFDLTQMPDDKDELDVKECPNFKSINGIERFKSLS